MTLRHHFLFFVSGFALLAVSHVFSFVISWFSLWGLTVCDYHIKSKDAPSRTTRMYQLLLGLAFIWSVVFSLKT